MRVNVDASSFNCLVPTYWQPEESPAGYQAASRLGGVHLGMEGVNP